MVTRRDFIRLGAVSSLGLVIGIPKLGFAAGTVSELHPLVHIGTDGSITLFAQNPDMGQGVKTALPMIIAEELDVDWDAIRIAQSDWDPRLNNQFSGGSLSIRLNYTSMRQAGAAARAMLLAAAAQQLDVPEERLSTGNGEVIDKTTNTRIGYADLATVAAGMPVPEDPPLKGASDFKLIGTSVADVDMEAMLRGTQEFSSDLRLPDMLTAVVRRCPHGDGQPASFDATAAQGIKGVVGVHELKNIDHGGRILFPNCPNFVSGVAVLATDTWAALKGARALEVEWDMPEERDDIDELMQKFEDSLDDEVMVVRRDGDERIADTDIDVVYRLPYLAHIPMEPMNCTAQVLGDTAEVWAPTQNPPMAAEAVATILGIPQENVTIHVLRSGGAFGRRYYADFIMDTVLLAREFGRPVKVVWPREDDIRHDYFRPGNVQRVRASVGDRKISEWHQRVVSHPREIYLERDGSPAEIGNYEFPAGFVPNLLYDYVSVPARIPLGQWRATDQSANVFVISSAIDELAHLHGIDSLEFMLSVIGDEQFVQVREDFRFDASRLRGVVELVADKADWGAPLAKGRGRGIAAGYVHGAWAAEVAEVTVTDDAFTVDKITCAVDCGRVINPQGARNQVAGGIIEGLSAALYGRITVRDGIVQESNFNDYPFCRIADTPEIDVHFADNNEAPRGVGEGPLGPVAPAVTNAIFAATGKRIRELPIQNTWRI